MSDRILKIALGQFASVQGDTEANLVKMLSMTDEAAADGAALVVFPELAYSGHLCPAEKMLQLTETQDGHFVSSLSEKAREKRIHIIAGYPEAGEIPGVIYNSAIFINSHGDVIGNMRKVYLWGKEKSFFRAGDSFPVMQTEFGKVGLLICYDAEFPEPARLVTLHGAELLVVCGIWSMNPAEHRWHVALQANAMFNLLFVAGCNATGENICGSSMIVGPDGSERVVASRTDECLLISEINLAEIITIRRKIPYLTDLKPQFCISSFAKILSSTQQTRSFVARPADRFNLT